MVWHTSDIFSGVDDATLQTAHGTLTKFGYCYSNFLSLFSTNMEQISPTCHLEFSKKRVHDDQVLTILVIGLDEILIVHHVGYVKSIEVVDENYTWHGLINPSFYVEQSEFLSSELTKLFRQTWEVPQQHISQRSSCPFYIWSINKNTSVNETSFKSHQTPQQDDSTRDRIKRSCLRNITPSRTIMMMINHGIQCHHLRLHRKHLLLVFLRQVRCHMTINTNDVKSLLSKMKRSVHTKQRY